MLVYCSHSKVTDELQKRVREAAKVWNIPCYIYPGGLLNKDFQKSLNKTKIIRSRDTTSESEARPTEGDDGDHNVDRLKSRRSETGEPYMDDHVEGRKYRFKPDNDDDDDDDDDNDDENTERLSSDDHCRRFIRDIIRAKKGPGTEAWNEYALEGSRGAKRKWESNFNSGDIDASRNPDRTIDKSVAKNTKKGRFYRSSMNKLTDFLLLKDKGIKHSHFVASEPELAKSLSDERQTASDVYGGRVLTRSASAASAAARTNTMAVDLSDSDSQEKRKKRKGNKDRQNSTVTEGEKSREEKIDKMMDEKKEKEQAERRVTERSVRTSDEKKRKEEKRNGEGSSGSIRDSELGEEGSTPAERGIKEVEVGAVSPDHPIGAEGDVDHASRAESMRETVKKRIEKSVANEEQITSLTELDQIVFLPRTLIIVDDFQLFDEHDIELENDNDEKGKTRAPSLESRRRALETFRLLSHLFSSLSNHFKVSDCVKKKRNHQSLLRKK